ncbi:hypothetical protein BMS3Abin03_01836 [bacterium BMS3Abin03]|nr:hypothetical protein BMS3Abin03_01836 [bacterium BMS3Abin03]
MIHKKIVFYISVIIFQFLFFTSPAYSQFNIAISAGTNSPSSYIFNDPQKNKLDAYWKSGFSVEASGEYYIADHLILSPAIEYIYYKFNHYSPSGAQIPEIILESATGEGSYDLNFFALVKFLPPTKSIFQAELITGVGYIITNFGKITTVTSYLGSNKTTNEFTFENESTFVHEVGLGIRVKILRQLLIRFNASYYSNYLDKFYTSVTGGIIVPLIFNN